MLIFRTRLTTIGRYMKKISPLRKSWGRGASHGTGDIHAMNSLSFYWGPRLWPPGGAADVLGCRLWPRGGAADVLGRRLWPPGVAADVLGRRLWPLVSLLLRCCGCAAGVGAAVCGCAAIRPGPPRQRVLLHR